MGKLHDLSGRRFGRLTVVKRCGSYKPPSNPYSSQPIYLCRCDCGQEVMALAQNLKQGGTKSCGCLRVEISRRNLEKLHRKRGENRDQNADAGG